MYGQNRIKALINKYNVIMIESQVLENDLDKVDYRQDLKLVRLRRLTREALRIAKKINKSGQFDLAQSCLPVQTGV